MRLNYEEIHVMQREVGIVGIKMASILTRNYHVFNSVSDLVRYCGMDCNGDVSNGTKVFKKLLKFGYIKQDMLHGTRFVCLQPDYVDFLKHRLDLI